MRCEFLNFLFWYLLWWVYVFLVQNLSQLVVAGKVYAMEFQLVALIRETALLSLFLAREWPMLQ